MPNLELFGTASCPYTSEMREWLEWKGKDFTEYDVEADSQARERMQRSFGKRKRSAPIPFRRPS